MALLIVEKFLAVLPRHILSSMMIATTDGIASATVTGLSYIFHNWEWREITEGQPSISKQHFGDFSLLHRSLTLVPTISAIRASAS